MRSLKISTGIIRSRNSNDSPYNVQGNTDNKTNNDRQTNTQKTKDRATSTPLKTSVNSGATERLNCFR